MLKVLYSNLLFQFAAPIFCVGAFHFLQFAVHGATPQISFEYLFLNPYLVSLFSVAVFQVLVLLPTFIALDFLGLKQLVHFSFAGAIAGLCSAAVLSVMSDTLAFEIVDGQTSFIRTLLLFECFFVPSFAAFWWLIVKRFDLYGQQA